jgi:DNA-binding NtrC family response regulator
MAKSSGKLRILYGEGEAEVMAAQAEAMEKAGHQVEAAQGRKGVTEALQKGSYDLVILGGTLTRDDRHHLPYMVKKAHAGLRVLVLHTDGGRHPYVDENLDTGSDLQHLLEKIGGGMVKAAGATAGK